MEPYKEEMSRVVSVRNGEPQHLPGILEDLPPMSVPMPQEALYDVIDRLKQLREVAIPDFLDSGPTQEELYAILTICETWAILTDMIRGMVVKKAVLG